MASQLISGQGTSRFVVTTPGPRVIRNEVKGQYRQQLLDQAASLLPDYQTLTDTLLEYDLPFADMQVARNSLDMMAKTYMDNYARDPFWAFTNEGRHTAQRMQRLVHDPQLKLAQDLKKQNDKELEKGLNEGVLDKILVSSQGIGVIRDGRKMYVQTPKDTDHVLTVNDEYRYLNEIAGSAGGKYVVPMRAMDKSMAAVRAAFEGIGETEWKKENIDPNSFVSQIQSGSSNERQIEYAQEMLLSKGGLSNEDWNTLKSEYLSSVASGEIEGEFSDRAARNAVIEMVFSAGKARRSTSSSVMYNENPFLKGKATAAELDKGVQMSGLEQGFYGQNGMRPRMTVLPDGTASVTNTARKVGAELFQTSTNQVYREDMGQKINSHRVKDLPLLADSQEVIYTTALKDGAKGKAGDFISLPADAYREGIIADGSTGDEDAPAFTTEYVGPDGKPIPYNVASSILQSIQRGVKIPQDYRKYVSYGEDGAPTLKLGQFVDAVMYVPKQRALWGTEVDTSGSTAVLEEHGFSMGYNAPDQKYINSHSGRNVDIIRNTSDFGFNLEDGYYKVRIKTPIPSYFKVRESGGAKVNTQLEDAHFDTGGFQNQSVPINPQLLDDNAFNPNLKTKGFGKFSQLK